jgi:thiol-disulfide isomerase/thioredoxin
MTNNKRALWIGFGLVFTMSFLTSISKGVYSFVKEITYTPTLEDLGYIDVDETQKKIPDSLTFLTLSNDGKVDERPLKGTPGKLTILHIWATWCQYCTHELPKFDDFCKAHSDVIVPINIVADIPKSEYIQKIYEGIQSKRIPSLHTGYSFNNFSKKSITDHFGIASFPSTFFIDEQGNLIAQKFGMIEWEGKEGKIILEKFVPKK